MASLPQNPCGRLHRAMTTGKTRCLLVVLLHLALGSAPALAQDTWEERMEGGWTAHQNGDYVEAETQFRAAVEQAERFADEDPRRANSLNGLALLYYAQGRYADALNCQGQASLSTECRRLLDTYNQVADGDGDGQADVPLPGAPEFVQVSVGERGACGLRSTGAVECWNLFIGSALYTAPGGPFTQVSVGRDVACGLTGTVAVECWRAATGVALYTVVPGLYPRRGPGRAAA